MFPQPSTNLGGSVVGFGDEVEQDLDDVTQKFARILVTLLASPLKKLIFFVADDASE
jgi:hypothetical protein